MITIVALFDLKPECKDAFLRLAAECLEGSRADAVSACVDPGFGNDRISIYPE